MSVSVNQSKSFQSAIKMTTPSGVPRAMQLGLTFCHLWWVFVLMSPGELITKNSQYSGFAAVGNDAYWQWRAVLVAVAAAISLFPIPVVLREITLGIQAGWLLTLTYFYLQVRPFTTGPGAYIPLAWIALIVMWLSWRDGNGYRRGRVG